VIVRRVKSYMREWLPVQKERLSMHSDRDG
jgi:hypothetical protein